jgi:predicted CXXCH cytochrome family protein
MKLSELMFSGVLFAFAAAPVVGVSACAQPEDGPVEIVLEGARILSIAESSTLSAETTRGTDHGYAWASTDETVATVDMAGRVTGVAEGEATITAQGLDTGATGNHLIIVLDLPVDSENAPYYERWLQSAHADASSPAFNHWNDDGEIPSSCARCHSREGFRDYLGDDGSEVGVVNRAAPIGSVVDCLTCHNDAAFELDTVTFPSRVTLTGLGPEARCMTCHQGRGSTDSVDAAIEDAGVEDDQVSDALSFQNIHFFPAAATLFAGQVRGGYQYDGRVYDHRFRHVPSHDTCIECHDPHSTRVRFDTCVSCHPEATDAVGVRDIRMIASAGVDYDGDGDMSRGFYFEVKGLEEKLYRAIQRYASEVAKTTICYSSTSYPYWFVSETGAQSECTEGEASYANAYGAWTPRLLRATYNYQMARKDGGAYVHNGRYVVKLLHDAISDLNTVISNPVDMSRADRDAPGHFNGASAAARRWDEDEAVSAACSRCHSGATGFRFFTQFGVGLEVPETANGLECYTCHETFEDTYEVLKVAATQYPGGLSLAHGGHDNICATCHSGRASKATIDGVIASGNLAFSNVHYGPAAGVRNGSQSRVGYEYEDRSYAGSLVHANRTQCTGCHDPVTSNHTFRIQDVWESVCRLCHFDEPGPEQIRMVHLEDYDGDGSVTESLRQELEGLASQLLTAMRAASDSPLCYTKRHPYWFNDHGGSSGGLCASDDATASNRFEDWTPALLSAAHNYQLHRMDTGGYAHNFAYLAQLLFDAIEDLEGDVSGLTRP